MNSNHLFQYFYSNNVLWLQCYIEDGRHLQYGRFDSLPAFCIYGAIELNAQNLPSSNLP
jgi:hypothetical protein